MKNQKIDSKALTQHLKATGQMFSLMVELGGLEEGTDEKNGRPCPVCGGDDRCWYSEEYGRCFCRKCMPKKGYCIFTLVMQRQQIGFEEAVRLVAIRSGFLDCADDGTIHLSTEAVQLLVEATDCEMEYGRDVETIEYDISVSDATEEVGQASKTPKQTDKKSKRFRNGTVKRTEYIYTDANGTPCHKIVRLDGIVDSTGKPDKTCFQLKMQNGHWDKGAPAQTFPYRLLDVLEADVVYVVEGEKTADCLNQTLRAAGNTNAVATTSPMGAPNGRFWKKYLKQHPAIASKRLIILPDNDAPGDEYAKTVAKAVLEANPEADVKVVELNARPLPEGGDFVDWYACLVDDGKDEVAAIETLFKLCECTEPVTPGIVATWKPAEQLERGKMDGRKPFNESRGLAPDIILNPRTPLASADKFLETIYTVDGIRTLICYAEDYWTWKGNTYRKIEVGEVKSRLLRFLELAKVELSRDDDEGPPNYGSFLVAPAAINAIEGMLKGRIFHPCSDTVPCWIGGESCEMPPSVTDPSLLIFGKSRILNLADMGTLPPSPYWFNYAALDFDYTPNAECPQWLAFLDSIFEGDEESKQTLMEWMGLCLTPVTMFQKALFLIGPKRSGKGTISRTLQKIVGSHNAISPATPDFGRDFGLQSFIGKTLAVVSDARFSTRGSSQVIERVLNITGEDMITINRKHREAITLRLHTKLMFVSNEIPNVLDPSGAFASRFIFLKLPKSFFGNEDVELENKLSGELPGILRLAIRHLQVLLKRKRFIQPETGKRLAERMTALSSPVGEFMQQLLPGMSKDEIWDEWTNYCLAEGLGFGKKSDLWNDLESASYNCDFDTADILAKIRQRGGEARVSDIRDGTNKYHRKGGTEALKEKLDEMLKSGILSVRVEKASNGQPVEYFSVANTTADNPIEDGS